MKNFLKLLATTTFLSLGVILPSQASTLQDIKAATVVLFINPSDGHNAICSAEFVSQDTLITASHCVLNADASGKVLYSFFWKAQFDANQDMTSGQVFRVTPKVIDRVNDVATLTVIDSDKIVHPSVDIASAADIKSIGLDTGTPVIAAGYPLQGPFTITDGLFTSPVKGPLAQSSPGIEAAIPEATGMFYQVTAPIAEGSSGGGLYTKIGDTYKLLGVASGIDRTNGQSFISFFSESAPILVALNGATPSPTTLIPDPATP